MRYSHIAIKQKTRWSSKPNNVGPVFKQTFCLLCVCASVCVGAVTFSAQSARFCKKQRKKKKTQFDCLDICQVGEILRPKRDL